MLKGNAHPTHQPARHHHHHHRRPPYPPVSTPVCFVLLQAELAEAHKGDTLEPTMTAEEVTEVERVFKDF